MHRNGELPDPTLFAPGLRVEVRARFDNRWKRGFEIAAVEQELFHIRRRSDGTVLPVAFDAGNVRREH